jgi:hypothetical protein
LEPADLKGPAKRVAQKRTNSASRKRA